MIDTATELPKDCDKALRTLLHMCDGKECDNEKVVLTKQTAFLVVHPQSNRVNYGQLALRMLYDKSVQEVKTQPVWWKVGNQKIANSMFEHVTMQAFHEMREERGLVLEKGMRQGGFYLHKAVDLWKSEKLEREELMHKLVREEKELLQVFTQEE